MKILYFSKNCIYSFDTYLDLFRTIIDNVIAITKKNVMQILSFGCLDVFEGQVWEGTDLKV